MELRSSSPSEIISPESCIYDMASRSVGHARSIFVEGSSPVNTVVSTEATYAFNIMMTGPRIELHGAALRHDRRSLTIEKHIITPSADPVDCRKMVCAAVRLSNEAVIMGNMDDRSLPPAFPYMVLLSELELMQEADETYDPTQNAIALIGLQTALDKGHRFNHLGLQKVASFLANTTLARPNF